MNPASTTKSTSAARNASMYARSASSSSFVRNLPGGMNRAGMSRSRARARIPASATSLNTSATSAGTVPAAQASAMATKFEPLPEPSTPMRNLRSPVTPLSYRHTGRLNKPQVLLGIGHCQVRLLLSAPYSMIMANKASEPQPPQPAPRPSPRTSSATLSSPTSRKSAIRKSTPASRPSRTAICTSATRSPFA